MEKINVLIIDDSAVVRDLLEKQLSQDPRIKVVATAPDPYIAREKIARLKVDVITLDVEMPRMDGLTFLKYLMKYYPIPVIMVSSLTDKSNKASLEAMELGAVDIVPKPGGSYSVGDIIDVLIEKIVMASRIDFSKLKEISEERKAVVVEKKSGFLTRIETTNKLIAIGASTGGTIAMEKLFVDFTPDFPPVVAVIHMPEKFTKTFADRLNQICQVRVKEGENNERLENGVIYIAPGNYHMTVKAVGKDFIIKTNQGPRIQLQRPSVDVLFDSVAKNAGKNSLGVILTGMGRDGAEGLLKMREEGSTNIAQDEESSIVFGMPKEAIDLGAAHYILHLNRMTQKIREILKI